MQQRGYAKKTSKMTRVNIQQNCIAHYREPIFKLLSSCKEIEFTVIADSISDTPFMKVVQWDTSLIRRRYARTHSLKLPLIPTLFWQPGAVAIVAQDKPDLVIALGNPYSLTTWALLLIGRLYGIPALLWGHGLLERESGLKWFIRRMLFKLASGQMLYGDYAKKLLVESGFAPEKLHVVYNSLDYDQQARIAKHISAKDIASFRQSLGLQENERLVVFTGRLQPLKRLDLLFHAIANITRRGQQVHIALVGEGSEHAALQQLGENLEIDRIVHFCGAHYDEQYLGLTLSASDLCIVPSGAGLSVIHAMAFGTPVIIHDQVDQHFPEWEAVQEGITGFFYKNEDVHDLSLKIEKALFPISCKAQMSQACQSIIRERYNPNRQVEVIVEAVQQTLLKKGGRRPTERRRPGHFTRGSNNRDNTGKSTFNI
jgi:glycosyltransferase involved in cell wall biosynthesis